MATDPEREVVVQEDSELSADEFLELAQRVWPGDYDRRLTRQALRRTINVTAREGVRLVGACRVLSDGYFFGTMPEILVDPEYQGQGIGRRLMEAAWSASPTSIYLGAQPGNEGFFEKLGYETGPKGYLRRKPRPGTA